VKDLVNDLKRSISMNYQISRFVAVVAGLATLGVFTTSAPAQAQMLCGDGSYVCQGFSEDAREATKDTVENGISNVKEDAPRCIKEGAAGAVAGAAGGVVNPAGGPAGGAVGGGAFGATNCAVRKETGKTLPRHGADAIDKGINEADKLNPF
jgi:hypothetical protein